MGQRHGAPLLEVRDLRKVYESKKRTVVALADLSFSMYQGEFASIVGPSGAGKTTLLKCISGLLPATSGTLTLDGATYDRPPAGLALVFQEYSRSLLPWLTVIQNIEIPLKSHGMSRAERSKVALDAIAAVGLTDARDAHPWQLSGGMQQRVAIARAIAYRPEILLMDEPFAAVDAQTRAELEDLVRRLWQDMNLSVLFVTHDIDDAVYLSQRVLVLSKSPSRVLDDVTIDLPAERDQVATRGTDRFLALRAHLHSQVQRAKLGPETKG
jgi:NitT/TauT family transport system ATP-binding protein